MYKSTILAILGSLSLLASASPAPVKQLADRAESPEGPISVEIPRDLSISNVTVEDTEISALFKRDRCYNTGADVTINIEDARNLQRSLQNDSPNSMVFVGQANHVTFYWGAVKLCIQNAYVFENTHIKHWDAGWAIGYLLNWCCDGGNQKWYFIPPNLRSKNLISR